jgi:hypothetical protein
MFRRIFAAVILLLVALGVASAQPLDGAAPDDAAYIKIAALIQDSAALSLPLRVERAFMLTLNAANDALLQGQHRRARTLLRTFMYEVRGVKRAKRLRPEAADVLIARAEEAIGSLRRSR